MGCCRWWWKGTSITQWKKIDADDADASDADDASYADADDDASYADASDADDDADDASYADASDADDDADDASDADADADAAAASESHVISSYDDDDDDDEQQQQQLPDDIIAEILSRLPSMHVMDKFRFICKQWFAVTSTQSFRELHYKMNQQFHTFVAQYHDPNYIHKELEILFFNEKQPTSDACLENRQLEFACFDITLYQMKMKPLVTQFYDPILISSYKGFLLFKHVSIAELVLIFLNPTTAEQVTVTAPASRYLYCGLYFHSPTEEYRVLFGILDDDDDDELQHAAEIRFAILGLRTRSLRRIKNFSHHFPSSSTPPIILNGALYWMVSESSTHGAQVFSGSVPNPNCSETILSFGMESEEFHVMPHPGKNCVGGGQSHDLQMQLMEMDGQLCLCVLRPIPDHLKLEIWVLEDYKKWIWVKRHVVMLGLWALHVTHPDEYYSPDDTDDACALFIDDGELMLDARSSDQHLHFLYNLKNDSLRRLEITKLLESGKTFKSNIMVVHHPSLCSLHTKKFGYVLSLNEVDDRVAEWNLNQGCRTYSG